ncbi:hypothetical protein [Clostridium sp. LP20]|uniref:hypothetical protein n=1 Tax=Clostridium sp. LP20 TaxID=3418665 RepID=UPI003EE6415E
MIEKLVNVTSFLLITKLTGSPRVSGLFDMKVFVGYNSKELINRSCFCGEIR